MCRPPQKDHIVELLISDANDALHEIVDHRLAFERRLQPYGGWRATRDVFPVTAFAVVTQRPAFGTRLLAALGEFCGGAKAPIGASLGKKSARDLRMSCGARGLIHDLVVPIELEPAQSVEDGAHCGLGRAGPIGVLDAQAERPRAWRA